MKRIIGYICVGSGAEAPHAHAGNAANPAPQTERGRIFGYFGNRFVSKDPE